MYKQKMAEQISEDVIQVNPSFKKRVVHEDDELYNKKEKEIRERERAQRLQAEQRQKEFEEREAEIWPKKKPMPKKTVSRASNSGNPTPVN